MKKGGKWHHLIEDQEFVREDAIYGEMYLNEAGYYPVLYVGYGAVPGEVYRVSEPALQSVIELESDANYDMQEVLTIGGILVKVFFFMDDTLKDSSRKIASFDAVSYFEKCKRESV